MKTNILRLSLFSRFWLVLLAATAGVAVQAQTYTVDWYKIAGGGGTSTGTVYSVTGTIGQSDASGPMTATGYSVTGGFWSLINVVQTPGLPNLVILHLAPNSVKVVWPDPTGNSYTLQQNTNLATATWVTSGFSLTNGFGTNFCTITPPLGNLFFRLKQ